MRYNYRRWNGKMLAFRMTFEGLRMMGHDVELKRHGEGWAIVHRRGCPVCATHDAE